MTVNFHSFVDMYSRVLEVAAHILAKGDEFAKARGVTDAQLLDWRLVDDMNPLSFQLTLVCDFSRQWLARAAGIDVPAGVSGCNTVADFQREIAAASAYVQAITPAQFAGRDDAPLTVTIGNGMSPTLPASQWITGFATRNMYFHLSMAYAILRGRGVQLGKLDLFPSGL